MKQTGKNQVGNIVTTKEALERNLPYRKPMPKPTKCKFCGKTLYFEGIVFQGSVFVWRTNEPQLCDCEQSHKQRIADETKKAEIKKAEAERRNKAKIALLQRNSGIGKRFLNCRFENFICNEKNRNAYNCAISYVNNFKNNKENGKGLYIEGTCGTGKTFLATAISLSLIDKGVKVIFKTSIELFQEIKKTYDNGSLQTEDDILELYKSVPLLIIDDLGKEQVTDWSMPILYTIINQRYQDMLPTIITTNYNANNLIKRLTTPSGDNSNIKAILSRLQESCECITMAFEDFRKKQK